MTINVRVILGAAALALLLAGCGGGPQPAVTVTVTAPAPSPEATASQTPKPRPSPSPQLTIPSPTPSQTPSLSPTPDVPVERPLDITCKTEAGGTESRFTSVREAWNAPADGRIMCDVSVVDALMDVEREALTRAKYEPKSLRILYSMCAEKEMGNAGVHGPRPFSEGQRDEIEGVFLLCPEHPDTDTVRGYMAAGLEDERLEAEGKLLYVGTYKVGEGIHPGTYAADWDEPVENCYWAVTDADGDTIANNFIPSAYRVQFTVPPNAHSVTIDGCGGFRFLE